MTVSVPACPHCFRMQEEIRYLRRELGIRRRDGEIGALMVRLEVTAIQSKLLLDMHAAQGKVVRGHALMAHLGEDTLEGSLKVHVMRIRKRLGDDAIETAYGTGYGLSPRGWSLVHAALRPPEMQRPVALDGVTVSE